MLACGLDYQKIVEILLDRQADVAATDKVTVVHSTSRDSR